MEERLYKLFLKDKDLQKVILHNGVLGLLDEFESWLEEKHFKEMEKTKKCSVWPRHTVEDALLAQECYNCIHRIDGTKCTKHSGKDPVDCLEERYSTDKKSCGMRGKYFKAKKVC